MQQRLISAAVLVPVVVIVFLLGAPWLTFGVAILAALAAYEAALLVRKAGFNSSLVLPVIAAPTAVIGFAWVVGPERIPTLWTIVAPGVALVVLLSALLAFRERDPADGFRAWMGTVFAALYASLLAFVCGFVGLGQANLDGQILGIPLDTGRLLVLFLVVTVWTLDSGAYIAGKYHHRGHFMNHISPNKTWSGAIGGAIAAVVVAALLFWAMGRSPIGGALLGLVIAVFAQAGDLAESMLKRAAGEKDSGTLIPGHGGFLDRVDSFLFAAPAMYGALTMVSLLRAANVL
jgi:phosphatidate cytidylyltransferase